MSASEEGRETAIKSAYPDFALVILYFDRANSAPFREHINEHLTIYSMRRESPSLH